MCKKFLEVVKMKKLVIKLALTCVVAVGVLAMPVIGATNCGSYVSDIQPLNGVNEWLDE